MTDPSFAELERRLASALTVDLVTTKEPLTKATARTKAAIASQMESTSFHVLPVGMPVTAFWAHPTVYFGEQGLEVRYRQIGPEDLVSASAPILEVVRLMAERKRGFYFVLEGADVTGLVVYADLNRRPVRAAIYALITELEEALRAACLWEKPDDAWLDRLPPNHRVQIESHWDEAREADIALDRIHYASLRQLVDVTSGIEPIAEFLDRELKDDWKSGLRDLNRRLRAPLAHPGKPLVWHPKDVERLWRHCGLARRVLACLSNHPSSGGDRIR